MRYSAEDVCGIWQVLKDGDATVMVLPDSIENGLRLYFSENQTAKMRSRLAKGDLSALEQDRYTIFDFQRRDSVLAFTARFPNGTVVTRHKIRLRVLNDLEGVRMLGSIRFTDRYSRISGGQEVGTEHPIVGDWRYHELDRYSPVFHVSYKNGRLSVSSTLWPSGESVPVRLLHATDKKVIFLWNDLSTTVTLLTNGRGCADCTWRKRNISWEKIART